MITHISLRTNICSRLLLCTLAWLSLDHAALAEDIITGKFELIDHQGQPVTERSFDGKLRLVFFGYTQCPDVCPATLFELSLVMRQLGDDASKVQPLFISIDRKNDTPQRLAKYVGAFHPSIVGLTGSEQQIAAAAGAFKATYGVQPASDGASGRDTVFHTAYMFLMDGQGRFLDVFGYGSKADVIVARLHEYL